MGAWGYENFEHDDAYDILGLWLTAIVNQIEESFNGQTKETLLHRKGNGYIIANVDIILSLCEKYNTYPEVSLQLVEEWKTKCIESFDHDMKSRDSQNSDYAKNRRPIIIAIFDKLIDTLKEAEE